MLYIEYLSLSSYFVRVIPYLLINRFNKNNGKVTYFSSSYIMDKYINTFYKENIKRYDYEIRGIKDEIGESITSKVFRNDAIIFVNIGGIEPLYSGAQKIKLSAFWNKPSIFLISLDSVFSSIKGEYNGIEKLSKLIRL